MHAVSLSQAGAAPEAAHGLVVEALGAARQTASVALSDRKYSDMVSLESFGESFISVLKN
jgi:hypothetical protein